MSSWFAELQIELDRARLGDRDPEVCHQVRVLIRRLRSAFKFVLSAHQQKVKGLPGLDRTLRRIAAVSGPVRDADVLEEHLIEVRAEPEAAAPAWAPALELMAAELVEVREQGRRALQDVAGEAAVVTHLARGAELLARLAASAPAPAELAPVLAARLDELAAHITKARMVNHPEEWHRVRIAIKRVRYATELLAGKDSTLLEGFTKMQSVLGKAHDHRVWQERAKGLRKRLTHRGLDVLVRVGLAAIAEREGFLAAQLEQRFAAECDAALGAGLRERMLHAFGVKPLPVPETAVAGAPGPASGDGTAGAEDASPGSSA